MTARSSAEDEGTWRRRLLPAAPLFVGIWVVVLLLALLAFPNDHRPAEPPAGRALPAAALAEEQPSAPRPRGPHRHRRRQLVDVLDREAPRPQRITIPAIGVSAPVVALRLERDGTMQTPDNSVDAGWYEPGPEPGERGAAAITGHVDSTRGPAVFYRLRELRRGDLIHIRRADRSTVRFRVEGLERWPKAAFPTHRVFRRTRIAALRLVTCSGNFDASTGHYVDNTIVYAARVPIRRRVD